MPIIQSVFPAWGSIPRIVRDGAHTGTVSVDPPTVIAHQRGYNDVMQQYVVDAFTDRVFRGNPAAVCLPPSWPSDELMADIAMENRLSETAFIVREPEGYHLRWFTPGGEIDLCGHATLASAYVVLHFVEPKADEVHFHTMSGELSVVRRRDESGREIFVMDFPAYDLTSVPVTDAMEQALGARPVEAWLGRDLLCVMDGERTVRGLTPDMTLMAKLDGLLVNVTAAGEAGTGFDCVSRSFAPKLGIVEDPVCGSGHCHILPYWSRRFGKSNLVACQASERGGIIHASVGDGRVSLGGEAALFSMGEILPNH
ncbi:PhzF family phenazine biosynthesis protein [Bifidobacterium primatium]|nr:PhzF family phenazine biosynthesis isomerase [Bifidobacterium primatium]